MIYTQSIARRSLLGEESQNPSLAARSLLGRTYGLKRVSRAERRVSRYRRRAHKGNPVPALLGTVLPVLGKLGRRFKTPAAQHAVRLAMIKQAVEAHQAGLARIDVVNPGGKPEGGSPRALLTHWAQKMATAAGRNAAKSALANLDIKAPGAVAAAPVGTGAQIAAGLFQPGTIRALAGAAKPRRARRQRYPTYVDRQGRQRYSYKTPGSDVRIPAGATPTPGTPYSFFRGAVGKGGLAATAGQLAVAGAAGVAAYLVTQRVLAALGGRALAKEEAGVKAAMALRQARADLEKQQGHPVTAAQAKEMGAAYKQQLIELGYDPVTFTRTRSGVETFLSTYNPFD